MINRAVLLFSLLFFTASSGYAQDDSAQARPYGYKDPQTAMLMGLALPGGGHFYAEETGTGMLIMGAGLGGPLIGYELTRTSGDRVCPEDAQVTMDCRVVDKTWTPLYVGAAVGVTAWVLGALDADNAARRANRSKGFTARVAPVVGSRPGLALRVRW